jgi:hypothetical protein
MPSGSNRRNDMKKTIGIIGMMVFGMALCAVAEPRLQPVSAIEAAMTGANYVMEITAADLTPTTADIAQTNTFTVSGPAGLSWMGARMESVFDDQLGTATTNDVSWTLSLGATTLINAAKVSVDQTTTTMVWFPGTLVATVAPLYGSATNGVDAMVTVVTNLSTAVTFASAQYATAASGGTITVTSVLTPSGGSPLASMKTGKLKAYFRKL